MQSCVSARQVDNLPVAQCEESERCHMESGHLLEVGHLTRFQFLELLETAAVMNTSPARWRGTLTGKVVGAIFDKPSTRTRASMAAAAARLGMQTVFLSAAELQTSRGETWRDT